MCVHFAAVQNGPASQVRIITHANWADVFKVCLCTYVRMCLPRLNAWIIDTSAVSLCLFSVVRAICKRFAENE